jgi:hypothetical protein
MSLPEELKQCAPDFDWSSDKVPLLLKTTEVNKVINHLVKALKLTKNLQACGKAFHDLAVKERDYERIRNDRLTTELAAATKEKTALKKFARIMFDDSRGESLDGEFIQKVGVELGLFRVDVMQKACGESCTCAEFGDFPLECYRFTAMLRDDAAIAAQQPTDGFDSKQAKIDALMLEYCQEEMTP